ncbi:MAG: LamG-like jellyroll fold domain-containing protein [Rhodanobacter sp.]
MQRQPIHFRLLATGFVFLSMGGYLAAGDARAEDSTAGPKPVASFDFMNVMKPGEGTTSVGKVTQVGSPFGCAAEFDGKSRISVKPDDRLNFNHAFSAAAWVNGSGARYRTMELAGMRSPNFQVVGDQVYFVTNSDPDVDSYDQPKKGKLRWNSAIWSGVADANLGTWNDKKRTEMPLTGLEPKLQVVGDRMYFQYFGNSADGAWQIYTGTSGTDGRDWQATQRTFTKGRYDTEQTRNVQVVGDKVYYAFPMKDKAGKWQLWTATSNLDGSAWRARQQTTSGGIIPSFKVSGDRIYYIFPVDTPAKHVYDVVIASADLDGSGWHEIRRIHGGAWWIIAQLTVDKGTIYFSYAKGDPDKSVHLWTGRMATDGSGFQERQRTFGIGNSIPAGVQVVGDKVRYAFSVMQQPMARMKKLGRMGFSFWTASTDLNSDHWTEHRLVGGDEDDHLTGYKMLSVVGGKDYYDVNRLHYTKNKAGLALRVNGVLAYSGSNILSKGDSYGIGMSASGSVSGFVNAGEDYLYRSEAPEDTAGAMIEQKLAPGWHHVAVTYDGNTLRLYVDGKLAREFRYDRKPAANPFPLSIGDGFIGKIARVMLFDRALDQPEISTLVAQRDGMSCRSAPR